MFNSTNLQGTFILMGIERLGKFLLFRPLIPAGFMDENQIIVYK
jgi:hypothetical protein